MIPPLSLDSSKELSKKSRALAVFLLQVHRADFINDITAQIIRSVPRYEQTCRDELPKVIGNLCDQFIYWVDSGDVSPLVEALRTSGRKRGAQGFSVTELISTILMWRPTFDSIRRKTSGPSTTVHQAVALLEQRLLEFTQVTASEFGEAISARLQEQNGRLEEQREFLADSISRLVSTEVMQRLVDRSEPVKLEGEQKHCTVMFADIRGFTSLSEDMEPLAMHALLNQTFTLMVEAIATADGTVDKFVGDKVMGVFSGAPADAAKRAVSVAIEIQAKLLDLNLARHAQGLDPVRVGIGINTGIATVGTIGSSARMDFTVIGDMVNVADRLQNLAGPGEVLVGGATAELIDGELGLESLGARTLKGRRQLELIYRVKMPGLGIRSNEDLQPTSWGPTSSTA